MKRLLILILFAFITASLLACSGQSGQKSPESADPIQVKHVPKDMLSSPFNPYGDMEIPDIFDVFGATFSNGADKLGGKAIYTLYMTGEGNMTTAVAYHADWVGLEEGEKSQRINEFLNEGFCQFEGIDGTIVTIRKTNPDDNRYAYKEGCLIEVEFPLEDDEIERYTNLAKDNFNLNAIGSISKYLGSAPDWNRCDFIINNHLNEVMVSVAYNINDLEEVQGTIIKSVETDWYDKQSGSIGISYGIIRSKIEFDNKAGIVYLAQSTNELDSPLSDYTEPENSLTKLGFGFDDDKICGVYEYREPHYMNVAIHRPEWGDFAEDWNLEYLDEVNGYGIRITYHAGEDKFRITSEKNNLKGGFEYIPKTKEYLGEYPDKETVAEVFNGAFNTQGDGFYDKPMLQFQEILETHFGLSMEELYALPIQ
ncbi:MAG: hypothetical protein RBS51_07585 [Anaerovoracaceae bacterium]|jgi:hypothetical protein|nr:hypothetical protein [Anaerovoracaceae bacterium]